MTPGLKTDRPLRRELADAGYSLLRAPELWIADELRQDWLSLTIDYSDLPVDGYLPGGGGYRFRRYGRFLYLPDAEELSPLPHVDYFQSSDINRVTGGIVRKFAPLLDSAFDNAFLRELIRFDFRQFPVSPNQQAAHWEVQVHLIRVNADHATLGHPTPEGIHRDGAEFVSVHLAELVNAAGGEISIYDDDKRPLDRFRLERVLDSYFFNDAILWHGAEPIRPINPTHRAVRSILTFDYHLLDA